MADGEMSFWDHLDVLRGTVVRSLAAILAATAVVFIFKSFVFDEILLAPTRSDFFMYRWLGMDFSMSLINTDISAQFFIHLRTSFMLGLILVFPYICREIWDFVAPGLYENEKKAVRKAFWFAGVLFYIGLAVGYILVLPVTLNFFQGYTVSDAVENTITLNSYISMFTSMVLLLGIVFEFPAFIAAMSSMGLVKRSNLKAFRKYALVAVLVVAAVITPADPFSMIIAALPLYALYELSIYICKE